MRNPTAVAAIVVAFLLSNGAVQIHWPEFGRPGCRHANGAVVSIKALGMSTRGFPRRSPLPLTPYFDSGRFRHSRLAPDGLEDFARARYGGFLIVRAQIAK